MAVFCPERKVKLADEERNPERGSKEYYREAKPKNPRFGCHPLGKGEE
jgi:hypothetical protein